MYTEGFGESVISIVQHYLSLPAQYRVNSARKLAVYTDSCSGQNRNKFMHAYFIHRICAGYHDEISWNFMAVGHTKFSPDRGFALIRNAQKKRTFTR